jgi:hypothetical protein
MSDELTTAVEVLSRVLTGMDVSALSGVECAALVETLARVEKRCAAVRALAAARAAACGAFRGRGFSDAATWLADASGISAGEARSALTTGSRLASCPITKEALLAGELSLVQAEEITKTERAAPGSEAALVELAGRSGVAGLCEEGRKRRLKADDADDRHRRQRTPSYAPPSAWDVHPTSRERSASRRAAPAATTSNGTTSTPSRMAGPPPTTTSNRDAGPITARKHAETDKPASSTNAAPTPPTRPIPRERPPPVPPPDRARQLLSPLESAPTIIAMTASAAACHSARQGALPSPGNPAVPTEP